MQAGKRAGLKPGDMGPSRLRILLLVLEGVQRRHPPTVRELAHALGCQVNAVNGHLHALRRDGWVTWAVKQCRTLAPTCRLIALNELEKLNESV